MSGTRFINRFEAFLKLHVGSDTESRLMRARACYIVGSIFIATQFVNLAGMTYSYRAFTADHAISIIAMAFILLTVIMLRWNKTFWHHASIYSVLIVAGVVGSAWPTGTGINTALVPTLILGIMINGFIAGWRASMAFGVVALATIWALWWNSTAATALPVFVVDIETRNFQRAIQAALAVVGVTGASSLFAYYMESAFTKLERTVRVAKQSERAKTEFLSTVSHELMTPLNAIVGLSDALRRTSMDSEQTSLLSIIQLSGETLEKTVGDVLTFSLLDTSDLNLDSAPLDLAKALRTEAERHRLGAQRKGLGFRIGISADFPVRLICDEKRIIRIVDALLSNAIQFTEKGYVEFKAGVRRHGNDWLVLIAVTDTGLGICKSQHQRIFERFTQADGSIGRSHGGMGLGLSISQGLARRMGGDLRVISEDGQGSKFIAYVKAGCTDEWTSSVAEDALHPVAVKANTAGA